MSQYPRMKSFIYQTFDMSPLFFQPNLVQMQNFLYFPTKTFAAVPIASVMQRRFEWVPTIYDLVENKKTM